MKSKTLQSPREIVIQRPKTLNSSRANNTHSVISKPVVSKFTDTPQTFSIKKAFNAYIDASKTFVSHNGPISNLCSKLSQQVISLSRAFNSFIKQADNELSSLKLIQKTQKVQSKDLHSDIFNLCKNFKVTWNNFSVTLESLSYTAPDSIHEKVTKGFSEINNIVSQILSTSTDPNNIHNPTVHLCHKFQNHIKNFSASFDNFYELLLTDSNNLQLATYKSPRTQAKDTHDFLEQSANDLENDLKVFSRMVNEAFLKEFTSTLPGNQLTVIKVQAISTCSDIIHSIKALFLFQTDILKVFYTFDVFHDLLYNLFQTLSLDYSNFPAKHGIKQYNEIQDELEIITDKENNFHFNEELDAEELLEQGMQNYSRFLSNSDLSVEFFSMMKEKIDSLKSEIDYHYAEKEKKEKTIEELKKTITLNNELEEKKQAQHQEEIDKLKLIIQQKDEEIAHLRVKEEDNDFKIRLRSIAKELGGALKEEAVYFNDDDDDQLISYVNALSVYVVEKKCQNCAIHKSIEEQVHNILGQIHQQNVNEDIIVCAEETKNLVEQLRIEIDNKAKEIADLKNDISESKQCLSKILNQLGIDPDSNPDDIAITNYSQIVLNASNQNEIKHQKQLKDLEIEKDERYSTLVSNLMNEFKQYSTTLLKDFDFDEPYTDDMLYDIIPKTLKFLVSSQKEIKDYQTFEEIICKRLEKHLKIDRELYTKKSIQELIQESLTILENTKEPLLTVIDQLEIEKSQAYGCIGIVANRLSGIADIQYDVNINQIDQKDLSKFVISILNNIQDFVERNKMETIQNQNEKARMREIVELLDLKMHKFLKKENIELQTLTVDQLLDRVLAFTDQITQPSASIEFISLSDLNKMFQTLFQIIPTSTNTDPTHYINEISIKVLEFYESIQTLKPFSDILNDIFSNFEWSYEAFDPMSDNFSFLKASISKLHVELNKVPGGKIDQLVYLLLSRSIALFSSFLTAISSMNYDNSRDKVAFYGLQQENLKLKEIIEKNPTIKQEISDDEDM